MRYILLSVLLLLVCLSFSCSTSRQGSRVQRFAEGQQMPLTKGPIAKKGAIKEVVTGLKIPTLSPAGKIKKPAAEPLRIAGRKDVGRGKWETPVPGPGIAKARNLALGGKKMDQAACCLVIMVLTGVLTLGFAALFALITGGGSIPFEVLLFVGIGILILLCMAANKYYY